ncbi:MAG: ATP-binding protein [Nostoc sp.]
MSSWQTFLVMEICRQYGLRPTEQEILLAKFPDENTVNNNNQVADQSLQNKQLPSTAETVRRQMWTIYNQRFAPQQDREGFLDNNKSGKTKDTKFLTWLKSKYSQWLETQNYNIVDSIPAYTDNPFTPLNDIITDQRLLYGREREITRIFETLNSGSSVALIGEKKIGKSSLLQAIYQQAQHRLLKPRKAIYLNLSLIFSDDDFYDELCKQVNIPVQKGRQLIRNLQQQQLLLLLDEVERMTWKGFTRDLRQQLRGLADGQANPPLRLVITASEHLDVLFPDSRDNPSPFQGVCIEEIIHPWDENIVRRFIHNRLMNTPISFSEDEIIQLIKESCGHPRRLMFSCHQIYSRYIQRIKTEL